MRRNGFEREHVACTRSVMQDTDCAHKRPRRAVCAQERYFDYDRHDFDRKKARNAMRRLLGDRRLGTVLLAFDGNNNMKPIGYLVLALGYSLEFGGRDAFIDEFFIMEEYRGKGIGKAVLAHTQRIAKKAASQRPAPRGDKAQQRSHRVLQARRLCRPRQVPDDKAHLAQRDLIRQVF